MTTSSRVSDALGWLERHGSKRIRDELEPRYGITTANAYGVAIRDIQTLAKQLGRDHDLAEALWRTGVYEARLLTAYVDDPSSVTAAQMDRWARDFDNWGIVDTLCFVLFDRTPHAWRKVDQWSRKRDEYVKRAGFVLLACLALHDKAVADEPFLATIPLLEAGAADGRNFVVKGVSWAIRSIGGRSRALNEAMIELGERLAAKPDASSKAVGKLALRDLRAPALVKRFAGTSRARTAKSKSPRPRSAKSPSRALGS
jgi:3-methyladenine DNA glycosylase AlkD